MDIIPIPAFNDNYIWAMVDGKHQSALIVDPGDADPVIEFLQRRKLTLSGILITHHHYDHAGGIEALTAWKSVKVFGPPQENIQGVTDKTPFNQAITFDAHDARLKSFAVPGHTLGHIVYYDTQHLFCGDTLFSAGCGRVFEGTFEQMYHSLQEIMRLDDSLRVYCAHEYTRKNLQFASLIEPDNAAVKARLAGINQLLAEKHCSLPSTLALEKASNPFLRCHVKSVIESAEKKAGEKLKSPLEVFTVLRKWKDGF